MHVLISGTRYDFAALNRASLLDLLALKRETGLSISDIEAKYQRLDVASKEPGYDFLGDEDNLMILAVVLWLCRRKAGERLSFEESADVPFEDIVFVPDADDEPAAGTPEPVEESTDPL